jgi:hypothetical protein
MKKFEYTNLKHPYTDVNHRLSLFNTLGEKGWEYIGEDKYNYSFKKEVNETPITRSLWSFLNFGPK